MSGELSGPRVKLQPNWTQPFLDPGVADLIRANRGAVIKMLQQDRLNGEVNACHAVLLALVDTHGELRIHRGELACHLDEVVGKPMGDLISITEDDHGVFLIDRRRE